MDEEDVIRGPTLLFPSWIDGRAKDEAVSRGYLSGAIVRCPDGREFVVFFVDPVRLGQELEESAAEGQPWFGEANLIVVNEVTMSAMETSVRALWKGGFFDALGARGVLPGGDT